MTETRRMIRQTPAMSRTLPRVVARARVRMERGGRNGEKAAIVAATYDAGRLVDRAIAARLATRARHRRAGTMPHVPSGAHQKKLADRREARRA